MESRPLADGKTIRLFAIGQLGWAILSGIISNWLVYYYMSSDTLVAEGMPIFITQGIVCAGLTVIGIITGCGRLLDGFIDPFIASKSDSLASPSRQEDSVHEEGGDSVCSDDGARVRAAGDFVCGGEQCLALLLPHALLHHALALLHAVQCPDL